jgi:hypothetical protein
MLHCKAAKSAILAAVSLLGVGVTHAAHAATTWIFDYTGDVQTFDAPSAGVYDITAYGAHGGSSFITYLGAQGGSVLASGGLGAEIGGDITLNACQTLTILVGGKGGNGGSTCCSAAAGGGGGGATYIVLGPSDLLLVAGGGGGAGHHPGGPGLPLFSNNGLGLGGGSNPYGCMPAAGAAISATAMVNLSHMGPAAFANAVFNATGKQLRDLPITLDKMV